MEGEPERDRECRVWASTGAEVVDLGRGDGRGGELTAEGELDGMAGGEDRVTWLFDGLLPTEINSVGG